MGKHFEPIEEKVKRFVSISDEGCWLAVPGITHTHKGYNCAWFEGRHQALHRLTYEVFVGPIPEGMDLGHKCHDEAAELGECVDQGQCIHRQCCNPEHLKPEPRQANVLSSPLTQAAINKSKTERKRGHEFTDENTRIKKGTGHRSCKTCDRMTPAERKAWDNDHGV